MKILACIVLLFVAPSLCAASTLSDAANSLSAGESIKITTSGYPALDTQDGNWVTMWSQNGYEHSDGTIHFVGKRDSASYHYRHFIYTPSTNAWTEGTVHSTLGANQSGHEFDGTAYDRDAGILYYRAYLDATTFTLDGSTWDVITDMPGTQAIGPLEYWRGRGIVHSDQKGIRLWNGSSWSTIADDATIPDSGYGGAGEVNTDGTYYIYTITSGTTLYRMDTSNNISSMTAAPVSVGSDEYVSVLVRDPASNLFIIWDKWNTGNFYYYDASGSGSSAQITNCTGDGSTKCTGAPNIATSQNEQADKVGWAVPIDSLGIIMFVRGGSNDVWLYKHSIRIPSAQDEKDTYTKFGWSWTAGQQPDATTEPISPYTITAPNIHGTTEGDDLWSYLMMYIRSGNSVYLNRANAWATYFKSNEYYPTCAESNNLCDDLSGYGGDHLYGYGLVSLYEYNGDTAALAKAETLGGGVSSFWSTGAWGGYSSSCYPTTGCLHYNYRAAGRHLLLIAGLYKATGDSAWLTVLNNMLTIILAYSGWDATAGMYFVGEWQTDTAFGLGAGAYASGIRAYSPFELGIFVNGLYEAWVQTGNATLKSRLIDIARFIQTAGLDSVAGQVGYRVSYNTGTYVITHIDAGNQVYTESQVNALVIGYKLTGDATLLASAATFFEAGTGSDGSSVDHFVDTQWDTSNGNYYLKWNKGELFYTYWIFENGGYPTVLFNEDSPSRGIFGTATFSNATIR